jgi:hypothetical protein
VARGRGIAPRYRPCWASRRRSGLRGADCGASILAAVFHHRLVAMNVSTSPTAKASRLRSAHPLVRHDSAAWRLQVWISFFLAATLAGSGLVVLPGADIDRVFMVMGYVFSVSSAFAVAKFVRDNETGNVDSPLWKLVVWAGFFLAMGLTAWGLMRMSINPVWKAYLVVSWLFLVSCVFTLAKTLRDAYEARVLEARLAARERSALDPVRDSGFDG